MNTDPNTALLSEYDRVSSSCPTDGYYSLTPYTSDCFRGDWLTIAEDHTPGDAQGNMLLVNAAPESSAFFQTTITGLKPATIYEFAVWAMNVCRISDKCPFPLLPNILIRLQTLTGRTIAQLSTGDLLRLNAPHWTQYRATFTMPANETSVRVTMIDTRDGGCGNDFALDDITLRECVKQPLVTTNPVTTTVTTPKAGTPKPKPVQKAAPPPVKRQSRTNTVTPPVTTAPATATPDQQVQPKLLPPPPPLIAQRANSLVKELRIPAGEITLNIYDNGEIDGDTVSIYHNNELLVNRARLTQKPITLHITVDAAHPHHELVMVAHNLGSIPPNTSLMVVTAGSKRYQVFISSTEEKNAKVVLDLDQ